MESPPPLSCYISQSSKKRVFPGGSSACMEADVVEIPPPVNRRSKSKPLKHKEVISPEIIDVDMDEDSADVILIDREVDSSGKGKETFNKYPPGSSSGINLGSGNGLLHSLEKNNASGSHYLINGDDFGADFYGENDYMNMFHDDYLYDDDYDTVQAHFDSLDIPPGVEVSVPWFSDHQENKMKSAVASTSTHSTSPIDLDAVALCPFSDSSPFKSPLEFEQSNDKSTSGSSSLGAELKAISYPKKWETSSSLLKHQPRVWNRSTVARSPTNLPLKPPVDSLKSKMDFFKSHSHTAQSWHSKVKKYHGFSGHGSSPTKPLEGTSTDLRSHIETMIQQRMQPPPGVKMQNIVPPGAVSHKPFWEDMPKNTIIDSHPGAYTSGFVDSFGPLPFFPDDMAFGPWDKDPLKGQNSSGSFSGKGNYRDPNEFLKNFDLFKRFDTVQDSKDHHYCGHGSSLKQPSKNWAKKIQEEWRILENDLPDTIYVRVYESRMDLLRAVIIGAEGTPYHDGLFFFDLFFPVNYPNVPPLVHYHSGGLRINPNLYHCGKVCLSLLNTWSGGYKEKWIPGVSTTLQVLVSIQGLILNAKPFFNEPGYANMSGTLSGEKRSLQYNENTFIFSLKTMVYSIRRPPKYFEDFVAGHFFKRAHDILVACKAYIDGAQVGCLVKGGVQDVDEGDKSCSQHFKNTLAGFIKTLVDTFAEVGVKDCDEFLSLAQQMTNVPVSAAPTTASYYY